jgi:hypothetical protein
VGYLPGRSTAGLVERIRDSADSVLAADQGHHL